MNLTKIANFMIRNAAQQYSGIVGTLCLPTVILLPAGVPQSQPRESALAPTTANRVTVNAVISGRPASVAFFIVNIVIAAAVYNLIPGGEPSLDLLGDLLGVLSFGFVTAFCATLLHLFCKLLRGRGSFWMTFSAYLQVSSTMVVVASFCALLWGAITIVASLSENPILVFPIVQLLLEAIYMPLALVAVHGFGYWKGAIAWWTLVVLLLVISALLYIAAMIGICS